MIRLAQLVKIPVFGVVGVRVGGSNPVAPRTGGATQESVDVDAFIARTLEEARMPGGRS
jgi:hypothetical protein